MYKIGQQVVVRGKKSSLSTDIFPCEDDSKLCSYCKDSFITTIVGEASAGWYILYKDGWPWRRAPGYLDDTLVNESDRIFVIYENAILAIATTKPSKTNNSPSLDGEFCHLCENFASFAVKNYKNSEGQQTFICWGCRSTSGWKINLQGWVLT